MNLTRFIERVFLIKRSQPSDAAEIAINESSARIIKGTGKRTAHKSLSHACFYLTANL